MAQERRLSKEKKSAGLPRLASKKLPTETSQKGQHLNHSLFDAAEKGDNAEIEKLLRAGADINAKVFGGETALMRVAGKGKTDICSLLIERGANVDQKDNSGWTALMCAAYEGFTQTCALLINNGAKIEVARIGSGNDDGEQAYLTEEEFVKSQEHPLQPIANAIGDGNQQMAQAITALVDSINAQHNRPKTVIRGQDGKIIGVQ